MGHVSAMLEIFNVKMIWGIAVRAD